MLANLSNNVYLNENGWGNYSYVTCSSDPLSAPFKRVEFNGFNTPQIVVAFRGTDTSNLLTMVQNAIADVSFVGSVPNAGLVDEVTDAANFVKLVEATNPTANITLTGHSLGGAIAQLVGKASGLDTYAFNAPGAQQLYQSLSDQLQAGSWGPPVAGQI